MSQYAIIMKNTTVPVHFGNVEMQLVILSLPSAELPSICGPTADGSVSNIRGWGVLGCVVARQPGGGDM